MNIYLQRSQYYDHITEMQPLWTRSYNRNTITQ